MAGVRRPGRYTLVGRVAGIRRPGQGGFAWVSSSHVGSTGWIARPAIVGGGGKPWALKILIPFSLQCCGFRVQRPGLFFLFASSLWFVYFSCLFERRSLYLRPVSMTLRRISVCLRPVSVTWRHVSVCLRPVSLTLHRGSVCFRRVFVCLSCPMCICTAFCLFALHL